VSRYPDSTCPITAFTRHLNIGVQDLVVVASRKIMGTTKEWGEVLFTAILWGGGVLLVRRMEGKIPKDVVLIYALGALWFGLVASFPLKRVFSFPLIFIPLGIIVVLLIWVRQKRRLAKTVNS
jgi:hypothetical protein